MILLVGGVLVELLLNRIARYSRRYHRIHGVTKHADDLGSENCLQNFNNLADVADEWLCGFR